MLEDIKSELAHKSLTFVEDFFNGLIRKGEDYLPACLRVKGSWMANYTDYVLGIYFLNEVELERVDRYHKQKWPPFPGFLVSEDSKPANETSAIGISGQCNYFVSNRTANMWAFTVSPGASFTVLDHFHEIKDSSTGVVFNFKVDLAFVLGLQQEKKWADLKPRLSELLTYTVDAWKKSHAI